MFVLFGAEPRTDWLSGVLELDEQYLIERGRRRRRRVTSVKGLTRHMNGLQAAARSAFDVLTSQ
jgi:hypothetical protein